MATKPPHRKRCKHPKAHLKYKNPCAGLNWCQRCGAYYNGWDWNLPEWQLAPGPKPTKAKGLDDG